MSTITNASQPYGHVFSTKSKLLNRDTFIFGAAHGKSHLFFGMTSSCHLIQLRVLRVAQA
jgi:hypothetical protein